MPASATSALDAATRAELDVLRRPEVVRATYLALGGTFSGRDVGHCLLRDGHRNGDASPSLSFGGELQAEGICHCFACGFSGDAVALVRAVEGLGLRGAIRRVEAIAGAAATDPVSTPEPSPRSPAVRRAAEATPRAHVTFTAQSWSDQRLAYRSLVDVIDTVAPDAAMAGASWLEDRRGIPLEHHLGLARSLSRDHCLAVGAILASMPDAAPACEAAGILARTAGGGLRLAWCGACVLLIATDAESRPIYAQARMTDPLSKARYVLPHRRGRIADEDLRRITGWDRSGHALGGVPVKSVRGSPLPFGVSYAVQLAKETGKPIHLIEGYIASMAAHTLGIPAIAAGGTLGFASARANIDGVHASLWDPVLGALADAGCAVLVVPDYDQDPTQRAAKFAQARELSDYLHASGLNGGPGIRTCRAASLDEVMPGRVGLRPDGRWCKDFDDIHAARFARTASTKDTP